MEYTHEYQEVDAEQEIQLRDFLDTVLKRKGLVLFILAVTVFFAVIYTFTAKPRYTASTNVLIERNHGNKGLDASYYYRYEPDFLDTQSEIIRSVNVGRRVVEDLNLVKKYRHYFFKDRKEDTSVFTSIKEGVKTRVKEVFSFLTSADTVDDADDLVDIKPEIEPEKLTDEDIIARIISGGLKVAPLPDTKIVSISYTNENPAIAQMITNAVVKGYMDEMLEIKLAASNYSLQWMTNKAQSEKEKLERSERALQKYMRDNDLVTVENRLTVYPQKLREFSSQLSRAEAERREIEALVDQIDGAKGSSDKLEKIPVFADSMVLKDLREKIYKAKQKAKELSKKYGPKHPVMIQANEDIGVLRNEKGFEIQRIIDATKNSYRLASSREDNLKELLEETKREVLNLNEKFIQYSILKREVDSNRLLYDTLQTSIKTAGATEESQSVNIWVVKEADFPVAPSYPNKRRALLLAIVFGLFGGVGLAFLIEYLDNTSKSEEELEKRYGSTVLGTVIDLDTKGQNIESYIVQHPLSALAESYRLIRSGLLLSSAEKPPETILITSMGKSEGKTTTTINIARVLAQDNRKVLVIDCDLRRPRTHSLFGMNNQVGLSDYLSGNSDEILINPIPGEKLTLITSGSIPPNPSELLSSAKMKGLVATMRNRYDFVLLDSPPIQHVTDSLALARIVDGTIVVVKFGKTTYDMLNGGMKKLRDVHAHILGFVLNGLKQSSSGKSYYYGYSGYYAQDEE